MTVPFRMKDLVDTGKTRTDDILRTNQEFLGASGGDPELRALAQQEMSQIGADRAMKPFAFGGTGPQGHVTLPPGSGLDAALEAEIAKLPMTAYPDPTDPMMMGPGMMGEGPMPSFQFDDDVFKGKSGKVPTMMTPNDASAMYDRVLNEAAPGATENDLTEMEESEAAAETAYLGGYQQDKAERMRGRMTGGRTILPRRY